MIQQLKRIFPSLILYNEHEYYPPDSYKWFITNNKDIIGIEEKELTVKENNILDTFLQPYSIQFPPPTSEEVEWRKIINGEKMQIKALPKTYRFVYFIFKHNQISPIKFKESMETLFYHSIPILWENENEGILIEEISNLTEEWVSYEQIIDVLMSDLYVNINFLVGPSMTSIDFASTHYQTLIDSARTTFTDTGKQVISFTEALPYLLIDQMEEPFQEELISLILKECRSDEDLLREILTFFQCNLNVSVAAKELHMHRNSLQYRLDKFFDKTGIDLREFHQAFTVYLTILVNMHREN
ncbi:PucR family transcriptional regulator [Virgibacillus halodenitrificans]|uniref:PucR family transcriptional regulator n=1 Tax=Virgibacillus halodenitrificans TaxID=1482 RepID=UPI000310FF27|nr:helix-turn-helix domain-containing protein [Virgibacillus halodenitrificans]